MLIAVANIKGGVGKTTTAIHLAACLQAHGPTLLLDGDPSRNATAWSERGAGLPFRVAGLVQGIMLSRDFTHIVLDTGQAPSQKDLREYTASYDLLVIPAVPTANDNDALFVTIASLIALRASKYKVLINEVPPPPQSDAARLRALVEAESTPIFTAEIPRLKVIETASAYGTTVNDKTIYSSKDLPRAARAWEAYQAVAKEILDA